MLATRGLGLHQLRKLHTELVARQDLCPERAVKIEGAPALSYASSASSCALSTASAVLNRILLPSENSASQTRQTCRDRGMIQAVPQLSHHTSVTVARLLPCMRVSKSGCCVLLTVWPRTYRLGRHVGGKQRQKPVCCKDGHICLQGVEVC